MRTAAYVFTGWHPIAEREPVHGPEWTEWEVVEGCRPRFEGHHQPRVPLLGRYDDRDPVAMGQRIGLAAAHGVDALLVGFFWCRGKRVFEEGLTQGVLGSAEGQALEVGLMWANRLPRHVLPVRRADLPVIAGDRLVHTDEEDFVALVDHLSREHFDRPNYLRVAGRPTSRSSTPRTSCASWGWRERRARSRRPASSWRSAASRTCIWWRSIPRPNSSPSRARSASTR